MPDDKSRFQGGGRPSKPTGPPGISSAEVAQLRSDVARLKKLVEEHLAEKNQWNTEVRTWVGFNVRIHITGGEQLDGQLLWLDRYTVSIQGPMGAEIVHKAHIVRMRKL